MGINVGFVYDPEPNTPGAYPESDVRLIADNLDALDDLAKQAGVTPLSDLGLADDPEKPETQDLPMLDPKDGLRTLKALLKVCRSSPDDNPEADYPEVLVEELEDLIQCLQEAADHKVGFRFTLIY